ncbi:MAG: hypothetical protein D6806_18775 [Deltaproteobacteria bacterium]|nr:MAG: hypothetical protein D6806_18775 [Deltaproteobacteria bacterium]
MKRLLFTWLLIASSLICGCSRGPEKPEQLVPPDAAFVAGAVRLDSVARAADRLSARFASGMAAVFWQQFRRRLNQRMGFDPADPDQWRQNGIDPSSGVMLAMSEAYETVLVLRLAGRKRFEKALERMLANLGAGEKRVEKRDGVELLVFSANLGERRQDKLFCAFRGDFALLAAREGDVAWLCRSARVEPAASLARAAWYVDTRGLLGRGAQLFFASNPARRPRARQKILDEVDAASLALEPEGIFFDAVLASSGLPPFLRVGRQKARLPLEKRLPPQTLALATVRFDPSELQRQLDSPQQQGALGKLDSGGPGLFARLKEGRTLLSVLGGNLALGVGLSGVEGLGRLVAGDVRDPELLENSLWFLGWADVKEPHRVRRLFDEAVSATAGEIPLEHRTKRLEDGGNAMDVYTLASPMGRRVHFLLAGNLLGICAGAGCTDIAADAYLGKGGNVTTRLSEGSRSLVGGNHVAALVLRLGQLGSRVSEIDAESLGKGGYGVKLVAGLLSGVLGGLKDLAVALDARDGKRVLVRGRLWLN